MAGIEPFSPSVAAQDPPGGPSTSLGEAVREEAGALTLAPAGMITAGAEPAAELGEEDGGAPGTLSESRALPGDPPSAPYLTHLQLSDGSPALGRSGLVEHSRGSGGPVLRSDGPAGWETTLSPAEENDAVKEFRRAARSASTLAAYRSDWARFFTWCEGRGLEGLPAASATVAAYVAEAATQPSSKDRVGEWRYAPATLTRWVATINKAHDLAGLRPPGRDPVVADTLAGIRRLRAAPPRRKDPLLLSDLLTLLEQIPVTGWPVGVGGIRNRCLLTMGWVGAFRRDELVSLTVGDVRFHPTDGLHVLVRQSKTDKDAQGRTYALPRARQLAVCAPCAYQHWLSLLAGWEGSDGGPAGRPGLIRALRALTVGEHVCRSPLPPGIDGLDPGQKVFRAVKANGTLGGPLSGHAVNEMIKRIGQTAGYDPARLGGHSLRSGFVTQAFRAGATPHAIMRQTGHADPKTLEIYAREAAPLVGNAVTDLDL